VASAFGRNTDMRYFLLILYFASGLHASAQTWFNGDPNKGVVSSIEDGYLVTKTPIKVLDPPKIDSLKVTWDRTVGHWKVELTSKAPLDKVYKPCRFDFNGWNSYTVMAGDRDGGSFLVLIPKSYEHSIDIRDALIKQLKLSPKNVSTEPKDAEKILD
jgi:hypothetical protein